MVLISGRQKHRGGQLEAERRHKSCFTWTCNCERAPKVQVRQSAATTAPDTRSSAGVRSHPVALRARRTRRRGQFRWGRGTLAAVYAGADELAFDPVEPGAQQLGAPQETERVPAGGNVLEVMLMFAAGPVFGFVKDVHWSRRPGKCVKGELAQHTQLDFPTCTVDQGVFHAAIRARPALPTEIPLPVGNLPHEYFVGSAFQGG